MARRIPINRNRLDRLNTFTQLWTAGLQSYQWIKARYESRFYTIKIEVTDEIYPLLARKILEKVPTEDQHHLSILTTRQDSDSLDHIIRRRRDQAEGRDVNVFYDSESPIYFDLDGHKIKIYMEKPEGLAPGGLDKKLKSITPAMAMTARDVAGRNALFAFIVSVNNEYEKNRVGSRLWTAAKWGEWTRESSIPGRNIDTVILAPGVKESLIADLERFIISEPEYDRLGIPWHRGYIFHGPPGTGKTSIARGLSSRFNLDLYLLSLHDLEADTNLINLVSSITPRSILLIEDVDVSTAATKRTDETPGVSMAGLLNALDGVATPHGLITMMMTNDPSRLDEALKRPGRADKIFHIDYLVDEQLNQLVELIMDEALPAQGYLTVGDKKVTAAEVIEAAKQYLDDAEMAYLSIKEFLDG